MGLTQLANLGEFIGGVAVLVTLAYLVTQTRQSRIAVEQSAKFAGLQSTGAVMEGYSRWRAMVSDPAIASTVAKANGDESLSAAEAMQLEAVLAELFIAATFAYQSSMASVSLQPFSIDVAYLVAYLKKNPGGAGEWHRFKYVCEGICPEFVAAIDGGLAESTA